MNNVHVSNDIIDKWYVFPCNKSLSFRLKCRINIGVCSSVNSVKYIYIYKSYDA